MRSKKKSCSLDPMPTKLLLEFTDTLLPLFVKLINLSLVSGQFPSAWKVALVQPLLKQEPRGHDAHPSIAVDTLDAISQYIKVPSPFC